MRVLDTARAYVDCRGLSRRRVVQKVGRLDRENSDLACQNVRQARMIAELSVERNELAADFDRAAIDVSTLLDDLRISRAETARVLAALTATEAALANATAVSDLPQHVGTQPPATWPERFGAGPAIYLGASPLAAVTDPGHVRAASRGVDDTQPLTTVKGVA